MKKLLTWAGVLALVLVGGRIYGCTQRAVGAQEARDKADREHAELMVQVNKNWLEHVARVLDSAKADTARAAEAKGRADERRARRAPASDTTDWKARAQDLEEEITDLRKAFADQQRAAAALLPVTEADTARLTETTVALDKSLDRERMKGRFRVPLLGGSLPKPPKWLAGTIGCAAGGLAAGFIPAKPRDQTRNRITGCASGAAAATIALPTD